MIEGQILFKGTQKWAKGVVQCSQTLGRQKSLQLPIADLAAF